MLTIYTYFLNEMSSLSKSEIYNVSVDLSEYKNKKNVSLDIILNQGTEYHVSCSSGMVM